MRMMFLYMIASAFFGIMYIVELAAYRIHNIEWLLLFMFFAVMERFEELKN